jgi:undecaprenyl-diphosphatase
MQLSLVDIIILAVVQGVTEFLPVSSSGHLVILAALMTPDGSVESFDVSDVNIVLHGGTLLSILVFYYQRVWRLIGEDRRLIGLLFVATLPAVFVGLGIEVTGADTALSDPLLAGCLLPVTGMILIWAARHGGGEDECINLTYKRAALIGLSQALAILPGLSRSGTTIATGLRLGLSPTSAATFSFLMAIPVIGGACLLETVKIARQASLSSQGETQHFVNLAIGAAVAFVVGLASLWLLVRWLERGRFQYFAWWCIPVGLAVVVWQLIL